MSRYREKQRLARPCLILIMGVAGSGKTTLAKEIVSRIMAVYLDNNHIVDAFFPHTRTGRSYERLRPNFYRGLYTVTEENLKIGMSVLLDVPHVKEVQTREWKFFMKELVRRTRAKLIVIRCFCSAQTLYKRVFSRGEPRDRWKLAHWHKFLRQQPIDVSIPFDHLDINTESDSLRNIRSAMRYILVASRGKSRKLYCGGRDAGLNYGTTRQPER